MPRYGNLITTYWVAMQCVSISLWQLMTAYDSNHTPDYQRTAYDSYLVLDYAPRQLRAVFGGLWQLMTAYDSLWQLMTAYDSLWQLMTGNASPDYWRRCLIALWKRCFHRSLNYNSSINYSCLALMALCRLWPSLRVRAPLVQRWVP